MKKRMNGEGSIYKVRENYFRGQVHYGYDERGKPIRKNVYGKTKKEVSQKIAEIRCEIEDGTFVDKNNINICDYIQSLLDHDKALNRIKESTYIRSCDMLKMIRKSQIKNETLQNCQKHTLNKFLYSITNYSNSSIQKIYGLIKRAFRTAYEDKLIKADIMANIEMPKSSKKKVHTRALTITEQQKLLQVLKKEEYGNKYRLQYLIMINSGMRMCEINALCTNDIDYRFRIIQINKSVSRGEKGRAYISNSTKTDAGERKIPLTSTLYDLFKQVPNKADNDLLFICEETGNPLNTKQVSDEFTRICKKYDIIDKSVEGKVTLHSLRHTYATRCIEAGMNAKVLQELLGHSDIKITFNTYTDAFAEFSEKNVNIVEQYLKEKALCV